MTLMKQSEFAELCKVSRAAVTNWRNAGELVMAGTLVDVEATHTRMLRHRKGGSPMTGLRVGGVLLGAADSADVTVPPDAAPVTALEKLIRPGESAEQAVARLASQGPDEMSFDEARRLKEYWLMRLNELEYDQKSRRVALIEDVAALVGMQFASVRTRLRAIGPNYGPQLARLKTPEQASAFISEVIDQALEELTADRDDMQWELHADAS
ncbi:hypothetical protein [Paraburkholderia sp. BCC1884]|uniref:hypothetical protein n=1 Tax=Paraburkholderia sp. BCC1884 TaxID=2562668 RepID=UPI0011845928|nr:hypothetical protein [Paraburkholderia sp. BCC1884]